MRCCQTVRQLSQHPLVLRFGKNNPDMFSIFCNNCFKRRDGRLVFKLNRCYHIVCGKCISKSSNGELCPVCKRPTKGIPIDREMPSAAANYFGNPEVHLRMYRNISKFQCEQRARYFNHFYEQQKGIDSKKQKLQGYIRLEEQLRQQIDNEKRRIAELRSYVDNYNQDDDARLMDSSSENNMPTSRRMSRPRTPIRVGNSDYKDDSGVADFKQLLVKTPSSIDSSALHRKSKDFDLD